MADIEKVKTGIFEILQRDTWKDIDVERNRFQPVLNDALKLLKEQQAEIERLKAEKNRVIEQIESEIHRLLKERGCVKDDVGIAQYQWLINGYQSALDMIKDGEQE